MMKDNHYGFQVIWSEEDDAFVATCPDFSDLSAFGATPAEALADAQNVLAMFIEEYDTENVELPPPTVARAYSGQLRLRLPASVHARLAERARREGVSLNALLNVLVVEGLVGRTVEERITRLENRFEEIESGSGVMTGSSS